MKEKTAMQELIDKMSTLVLFSRNDFYLEGINDCVKLANCHLEKEKEQIMEAYWNGNSDGHIKENYLNEYYNETYKHEA